MGSSFRHAIEDPAAAYWGSAFGVDDPTFVYSNLEYVAERPLEQQPGMLIGGLVGVAILMLSPGAYTRMIS